MKVFGGKWFHEELEEVPTPVGQSCLYCEETIVDGDQGIILPLIGENGVSEAVQHRECSIRSMVGSVAHQQGRCHCYGGTEEDPPGMTKREAAKAAAELAAGRWRHLPH